MDRAGRVLREGLMLGAIGSVAVAGFYSFLDLLAGRGPVFTLNLLGQVVFRGIRDPAVLQLPVSTDADAMVSLSLLHLGVGLGVGLLVSWLVHRVEERPRLAVPVGAVLVAGYLVTISGVRAYTLDVAPLLPFWSIVVANTLVALGGAVYLWSAHPGLLGRTRDPSTSEAVEGLAGL